MSDNIIFVLASSGADDTIADIADTVIMTNADDTRKQSFAGLLRRIDRDISQRAEYGGFSYETNIPDDRELIDGVTKKLQGLGYRVSERHDDVFGDDLHKDEPIILTIRW